ncbi:DUF937 domain-containing protein [Rhizobium deserti]|uniref:DUF937 domain-containing protein n=1 Tax=Rhizobium deserti TaxID=2547961 RepID=A0A4R5UKV8_9HYPH|nr:DUF937 domain-containing protein [Rhizobium deserti]TDK37548.1 DUF937 domain-containing protein [Rhizobium deserti]
MLPLFDMMLQAQNGEGMQAMAKQFGLAQEQAAQAMAALMPAFSSGLKRTSANPYDLSALMNTIFTGSYAQYFDDVTKSFMPQGMSDGNAVLQTLFGSQEILRAIAAQAEQLTGISQDILAKMMPVLAGTMMGGLFKQMTGQIPASNEAMAAAMARMNQQWLEGLGLQPKAAQQPASNPLDNPFAQAMRSMWGLDKPEQPQPSGQASFVDNPFGKAFQDLMGGGFALGQPAATSAGTSKDKTAAETNPYQDMMNSMFDTGLEVQKSYQANMEAILDRYMGSGSGYKPAAAGVKPE